jgi:hypothetical protein
MTLAFANVFDDSILQNIQDFIPEQTIDWQTLYGKCRIYQTDHYITYGGGPEGGYVYFYREREAGWYHWHRGWNGPPEYNKIEDGIVVFRIDEDGCEFVYVAPHMWEYEQDDDEVIIIGDDEEMQGRDREN